MFRAGIQRSENGSSRLIGRLVLKIDIHGLVLTFSIDTLDDTDSRP